MHTRMLYKWIVEGPNSKLLLSSPPVIGWRTLNDIWLAESAILLASVWKPSLVRIPLWSLKLWDSKPECHPASIKMKTLWTNFRQNPYRFTAELANKLKISFWKLSFYSRQWWIKKCDHVTQQCTDATFCHQLVQQLVSSFVSQWEK